MTVKLDFKRNGVILWHEGVITDSDLIDVQKKIMSHTFEERFEFQLIELADVTEFKVSASTMKKLGELDRKMVKKDKHFAVVSANTELLYGMSRIWDIAAEDENTITHVKRNLKDAIDWLRSNGVKIDI